MWIASISIDPFDPFEPFSVDAAWGMVPSFWCCMSFALTERERRPDSDRSPVF
jgi:hypothetical protein